MQNMAGRQNFDCLHSEILFKRDDGSRIVFYMRPCAEREKLRPVIEHGGGKITSKYLQGSIKLAEKGALITTDDYLTAKYVEDCVQENKLLDPINYKLKKGQYSSSTRKEKNVVLDGMDPADVIQSVLYTKSRSKNSKGTEGRQMYTQEDDLAMLNYIVTEVKYNETGGYQVFRDMQIEKVTKHSFMSMHTRFRKHILPNIETYDIPNRWKYLVTGDSKYDKCQQTGVEALFKSKENPQNQTGSSKKKGLFSLSKFRVQMTDQSENQSPQKGSDLLQSRNSSTKKVVTLDGKQTSTDETNPTISPAKGSIFIKDNSEETDKVTDMENQKKNKSIKQNTNNSITSGETPKKRRNRMLFDTEEAVSFPIQTKQAEDIASEPVETTSPLDLCHTLSENESDIGKTVTPREEKSVTNQTAVVSHRKAEAEENINHGKANVAKKHARVPDRQQNKANSSGGLFQQIKSPVKQQNENDSERISHANLQKKGSSDITINENPAQNSKDFQMNSVEGVSIGLIQNEKNQPTLQSSKARYEPLKFMNQVKQGCEIASQENDASKTVPSNNRMQNRQVGNTTDKDKDKNFTICKKQFPTKSVPSSSNRISKYMKNDDKQKIQSENSGDSEDKVLDSDSQSFATADNAEMTVSDDDASFISCEDEFDRHLLEKLETSNSKSGTDEFDSHLLEKLETSNSKSGSDLKTQNTCMKDFRRKNASKLNHTNNEQNGNDSNSTKGKSPIKRKNDSLEQLESSDEESGKIKICRKFAPSKQTPADPLIYIDSSEPAESETAGNNNLEDAKSRKPQRGKSGGGWNRFVDYSGVDSEIVEDSVEEEEEEKEVALEETVSGRGNKRSAKNPAPYLDQILDTDVESQTGVDSEIVEDSVEEEEEEKEVALEETVSGRGNKRSAKNPAPYLDQILDTDVESQTGVDSEIVEDSVEEEEEEKEVALEETVSGRGNKRSAKNPAPYLDQILDTDVESQTGVDSEIVEDSVEEEEEEKEVALEETVSGRGNKRSAKNPAPYLDQILDTDVESQTDDLTQNPVADRTAEIYDFEDDDTNAAQVNEVCKFLQRTAEQFSIKKSEVFEILLSCNGDTKRAVSWIRFGNDSIYLSPWKLSDDKKLMDGEDIVRLELVYGAEEVRERALFLEILERH